MKWESALSTRCSWRLRFRLCHFHVRRARKRRDRITFWIALSLSRSTRLRVWDWRRHTRTASPTAIRHLARCMVVRMVSPRARCFQWRRLVRILTPFEWENAFAHSRSFHALRRFDAAHTTHAVVVCTFASWRAARTSMSSWCFRRASRRTHTLSAVPRQRSRSWRAAASSSFVSFSSRSRSRCSSASRRSVRHLSQNLSAERFAARREPAAAPRIVRRASAYARQRRTTCSLVRLPYASRARRRIR